MCEVAEQMVYALQRAGQALELEKVDISDCDELFERYSLSIPVLRKADGSELGWPFSQDQLQRFMVG